ncbi:uncharacterized protein LOC119558377 [Drosophila subpulchrella]|uniref:uncharacterized protein LOC119558377 n=1 Tax=Drosophila subpulchrella TaxID=1486046 RepID=UPI0018A1719B|nr:uncharacterized protein LOC119558377 [Drosophila subpulchrella]
MAALFLCEALVRLNFDHSTGQQVTPGQSMQVIPAINDEQFPCKTFENNSGMEKTLKKQYLPGAFGWAQYGIINIPYIYRRSEKYVSLRMLFAEPMLFRCQNYMHPDVFAFCNHMARLPITYSEMRLLNEINRDHCDGQFSTSNFTLRDTIIRISDAYEFYLFMGFCCNKLTTGSKFPSERCSFIRAADNFVVPYIVRNNQKIMPIFFFTRDSGAPQSNEEPITGWDLSYMKFCCRLLGIREEYCSGNRLTAISFDEVDDAFPSGEDYEECWPKNFRTAELLFDRPNVFLNY